MRHMYRHIYYLSVGGFVFLFFTSLVDGCNDRYNNENAFALEKMRIEGRIRDRDKMWDKCNPHSDVSNERLLN